VALTTAMTQRRTLLGLTGSLSLALACLPEDDLSTYSRAWSNQPGAPATVMAELPDAAAAPRDNGGPSGPPGDGRGTDGASPPDAGGIDASLPDAGAPPDAGSGPAVSDDAGSVVPAETPVDGGSARALADAAVSGSELEDP
jgi:hypothetical protein